MEHKNFIQLLYPYLDGECALGEQNRLRAHLEVCPDCRAKLEIYKKNRELFLKLAEVNLPADFELRFQHRLQEEIKRSQEAAMELSAIGKVYRDIKESLVRLIPAIPRPIPVLVRAVVIIVLAVLSHTLIINLTIGRQPGITFAKGEVRIYNARNNRWQLAKVGMRLNKGDIFETGAGSQLDIGLTDMYRLRFKDNTRVIAIEVKPSRRKGVNSFHLAFGKMLVSTEDSFKDSRFVINTPLGEITNYGTTFLVEASSQRIKVAVSEGKVEVVGFYARDRGQGPVLLSANNMIDVFPNQLLPPAQPISLELLKELNDLKKMPAMETPISTTPETSQEKPIPKAKPDIVVRLVISNSAQRVREFLRPAAIYTNNKWPAEVDQLFKDADSLIKEAISTNDVSKHQQAISLLRKIVTDYPHSAYNVELLLYIASQYEFINKHTEAIQILEEILEKYRNDDLASLAQCAIGIIYEEKLNQPQEARHAYEKVLKDYPDSLETQEAQEGIRRLE